MDERFASEVEDRLVRYARIDTQSDESSTTSPSTSKQYDLIQMLADELGEMGARDVVVTTYGAVLATLPSTVDYVTPTVGFLAHVDTSPAFNATGVQPIVHRNYDGGDITFPDNANLVLSPVDSPYLRNKVGDDIVTASGTTLLGADDKAGIAIIMAMAGFFLGSSDVAHGDIRVCFTPDEEIGRGVHANLPDDLGANVAYTLDGAALGEVVYETFSADKATVTIEGVSAHPGQAKDTLVNALHLAAKIIDTFPMLPGPRKPPMVGMVSSTSTRCPAPPRRRSSSSSCATSRRSSFASSVTCSGTCAPRSPRQSRERGFAATSHPSTGICATGWRTTCARSSSHARRVELMA